jgi:hypothetical protein
MSGYVRRSVPVRGYHPIMQYTCYVCGRHIDPSQEEDGSIHQEGITEGPRGMAWVGGPVTVHEQCRLDLRTPFDEEIGGGRFVSTWDKLRP